MVPLQVNLVALGASCKVDPFGLNLAFFGFSLICCYLFVFLTMGERGPMCKKCWAASLRGEIGWIRWPKTGHPKLHGESGSTPSVVCAWWVVAPWEWPLMSLRGPPDPNKPLASPGLMLPAEISPSVSFFDCIFFAHFQYFLSSTGPENHHPKWGVHLAPRLLPSTTGVLLQYFRSRFLFQIWVVFSRETHFFFFFLMKIPLESNHDKKTFIGSLFLLNVTCQQLGRSFPNTDSAQ